MPEPVVGPRLTSKVPFLFGVANRPRLPGTVLVRLLGELGESPSASRSVLARMRREGSLRSFRRGRATDYELSGLVNEAYWRVRVDANPEFADALVRSPGDAPSGMAPFAYPPGRRWTGELHGLLLDVPEADRAARDRLRRATTLAGYARLRPGLVVSPWDRRAMLAEVIASLPDAASVTPVKLIMKPDDARVAAAQAWMLSDVAVGINELADRLERAVATSPAHGPGTAALQGYIDNNLPAYLALIRIPKLPSALLPDDWPMPRLVDAMAQVRKHFGAPATEYVTGLLAD